MQHEHDLMWFALIWGGIIASGLLIKLAIIRGKNTSSLLPYSNLKGKKVEIVTGRKGTL